MSVVRESAIRPLLDIVKALPLALLATASLVIFMERLIHMTEMEVVETPDVRIEDPIWKEPITEIVYDKALPKKPEPIDPPPEVPPTVVEVDPGHGIVIPVDKGGFKLDVKPGISFSANMPIAQYLGAASYPSGALRRGIEGYVDVMFDVTEFGGTDNIEVLAALPEGVFEGAAIKAVSSWRFRPKTVDDKPVRFEGMRKRVRFEMEK